MRNQYGTQTKLLAQLELTDGSGKISRIVTDESWKWSDNGPITFADNKDGEIVDARKKPTYSGNAKLAKCKVVPSASNNVALTEHERFSNPKLIVTPKGAKVLDFGQNIAGYVAFTVNARAGQRLVLRFGEMFDGEGEFTQKNIQCATKKRATPLQKIEYVCKGGVNTYKTKFAIFGFQYMLVEGDAEWKADDFTAVAVYSDMQPTLSFDCSHNLINKFVQNTMWSAKNNHADVPTDCPTRERHGWTGDAQIFVNTASYLFDYDSFARKYIADMCDGQHKNGCFRQITPRGGIDFYMNTMDGSAGWSDAGVLIPYRLWKQYGDKRIISENYAAMKMPGMRDADPAERRSRALASMRKRGSLCSHEEKHRSAGTSAGQRDRIGQSAGADHAQQICTCAPALQTGAGAAQARSARFPADHVQLGPYCRRALAPAGISRAAQGASCKRDPACR